MKQQCCDEDLIGAGMTLESVLSWVFLLRKYSRSCTACITRWLISEHIVYNSIKEPLQSAELLFVNWNAFTWAICSELINLKAKSSNNLIRFTWVEVNDVPFPSFSTIDRIQDFALDSMLQHLEYSFIFVNNDHASSNAVSNAVWWILP